MQQGFNRKEIIEKITPVIENAAMKNGLIPIEIEFQKESGKWFLRIFVYCNDCLFLLSNPYLFTGT